ncbi:DNA topoisomerase 6 subunit A [Citrus sinensis]|nr:DNA topoisomerase 6 subunit A [Citrus sinensis]
MTKSNLKIYCFNYLNQPLVCIHTHQHTRKKPTIITNPQHEILRVSIYSPNTCIHTCPMPRFQLSHLPYSSFAKNVKFKTMKHILHKTDEADDYKKIGYRICDYADADGRTDEAEDDKKVGFCICHDAYASDITNEAEDDKKVGFRICDGAPSERAISDTIAKLQTLLDKLPKEECQIQNDETYIAQDIPREHALKLIKDLRQNLESIEKDSIPYTYRSVTFITHLKRFLYFEGTTKNLDKESERSHNIRYNRTRIKTDSKLYYTIHLLCSMVGCTRESLHIISSEKGVVIGDLVLQIGGKEINCAPDQQRIPASTEKKKKTVLDMLEQIKFHETYNCILLTGCGMPYLATRFLLREIRFKLKKSVLGSFDCNPYGIHILTVYMFGSKNMVGRNLRLAVPNIKWLGLFLSDLEKYNIPKLCRQILSKDDISNLKIFLEKGDLDMHGYKYLTNKYLPSKFRSGDWL